MQKFLVLIGALVMNQAYAQWDKVAKPYQDKMDYYSAAKAYEKALDTGNVKDFVAYTRVLYNQGQYAKTFNNYKLLWAKHLINEPYDLQAFKTCVMISGNGANYSLVNAIDSLSKIAGIKGFNNDLNINKNQYTLQTANFNSVDFEDLCPIAYENQIPQEQVPLVI